ncbi:hypothetical protein TeGR_g8454 [Tetraparma gracilis]|uniref:Uncharacterized protein n=1 Tax=Tetraparma gracilis TaxID=2962635 RepID=A0ABQ6MV41_9STRA|nr:hypothetical protein TeGR_g8454 [Tetraparma gracilis]
MSEFSNNKASNWNDTPPSSPGLSGISGSPSREPGAWVRSAREGGGSAPPDAPPSGGAGPGGDPAAPPSPAKERPRLKLAKRTKPVGAAAPAANSSIFGAARSREEVLKSKGVSLAEIDARVNKKAEVLKLTKDQEEEAEACRGELAFAEKELNEANEMELPEGDKREKFDAKKAELQDLLDGFQKLNMEKAAAKDKELTESILAGKQQRFERPSERRARQEAEEREGGGGGRGDRDRDRDRDGGRDGGRRGGNRDDETFGGGERRDRSDSFGRRDRAPSGDGFGKGAGKEAVGGGGRFFD